MIVQSYISYMYLDTLSVAPGNGGREQGIKAQVNTGNFVWYYTYCLKSTYKHLIMFWYYRI